jgi:hypothetical protein
MRETQIEGNAQFENAFAQITVDDEGASNSTPARAKHGAKTPPPSFRTVDGMQIDSRQIQLTTQTRSRKAETVSQKQ